MFSTSYFIELFITARITQAYMYTSMYIYKHAFLSLFLCLLHPSLSFFLSLFMNGKTTQTSREKNTYIYIYIHVVEPAFNCSSTCIFSIQLKYMYTENYQANGIKCVGKKINGYRTCTKNLCQYINHFQTDRHILIFL